VPGTRRAVPRAARPGPTGERAAVATDVAAEPLAERRGRAPVPSHPGVGRMASRAPCAPRREANSITKNAWRGRDRGSATGRASQVPTSCARSWGEWPRSGSGPPGAADVRRAGPSGWSAWATRLSSAALASAGPRDTRHRLRVFGRSARVKDGGESMRASAVAARRCSQPLRVPCAHRWHEGLGRRCQDTTGAASRRGGRPRRRGRTPSSRGRWKEDTAEERDLKTEEETLVTFNARRLAVR